MYVPTEKFLEDVDTWVGKLKQAYQEAYGKYSWYQPLTYTKTE